MPATTEEFVNFYAILPGIVETSNEAAIRKAIREQRQIWNKRAAQADPVKREQAQKRVRDLGQAQTSGNGVSEGHQGVQDAGAVRDAEEACTDRRARRKLHQ